MKKMTKRMLSMFLAAVLVFTTVPFTAIVAFAKRTTEPTSYAYLTNGIDSAFTTGSGVAWDTTEKAAYFDGSHYLSISSFNAFSNVSSSTGFAVSFDMKKEAGMGDWGFALSISDGTNNNRFAFAAGKQDDFVNSCSISALNNVHNFYYSNDFGNNNHSMSGTPWNSKLNTWYNITLYFSTTGEYSYYVDGNLQGTFRNDYNSATSNHDANSPSGQDICNAIKNFTNLKIGAGAAGGELFKGYIKDVQFYDFQDNAVTLKTALDVYNAKMTDGFIYKKLSQSYTEYQKASARYDAYIYGEVAASGLTALTIDEIAKLVGSPRWSAQTAPTRYRGFSNDSSDYEQGYHKLLYLQSGYSDTSRASGTQGDYNIWTDLYYPEATMLYDGATDKPTLAMIFRMYCSGKTGWLDSNKTRYGLTAFNEVSNVSLGLSKWKGSIGTNNDATWGMLYGGASFNASNSQSDFSTSDTFLARKDKTNYEGRFANYIVYNGTMNDSTAYTSFKPKFTMYGNLDSSWKTDDGLNRTLTGNTTIYVINYARYINKIESKKSVVAAVCGNIANFKEGGATAFLAKVDEMTGFDITLTVISLLQTIGILVKAK